MTTLQKCLEYLDEQGIRYARTTHSPAFTAEQVAAAEHIPAHRIAKTVICRDSGGYLMVVVPADRHIDLAQLRTALDSPTLCLADESELYRLFPHADLGTMPPLGNLFQLRVYLDREVANQEFIAFTAGTYRDVIHMRTADFQFLVRPVISDFSQPNYRFSDFSVSVDCA